MHRNNRIASSGPFISPLREGITRSFSAWVITACFLFQSLCSVSASAQGPQGSATARPAAHASFSVEPAEGLDGALSPSGEGGLPEAPLPQVARAIPPAKLFAFGPSAGMPMPARPPQGSGQGTNGGSVQSNKAAGWWIGAGLALMATGGIMIAAAQGDHCGNPPCTTLKSAGEGLVGGGAIWVVLGALLWHRHPAEHPEAAPVSAPPPSQPQGNTVAPAQAIGRNPNGATTTTIRNNTAYTLQVQIGACPSCLSLTVQPGQNQTVNVNPGQYQETVWALGSNAPPYQGWQTYGAGTDWEETYFITTR